MKGIDISVYQSNIDWAKVAAAGVAFCLIQLTQGVGYTNPIDHAQSVAAQAAGIKIGYYHYGHPEKNSAKDEASHFISVIRNNAIPTADIIPALDVEQYYANGVEQKVPYNTLEQWVNDFCAVMADNGFPKVMLYSNPSYLNANLPAGHSLGSMPLWISEYAGQVSVYPSGWTGYAIWQNSGSGTVDGIPGQVDTDVCDDLSPLLLCTRSLNPL